MKTNIKYVYYHKCKNKNGYNFGDMITSYIYNKKIGKNLIRDIKGGKKKETVLFGAGSILSKARNNSIVWGSGFMFSNSITKNPKILSVRGPLTRNRLIRLNKNCPEVYGDIGLILPKFYKPKSSEPKYKIGIIPHYVDYNRVEPMFRDNSEVLIIDVTDNIEKVIDNINLCEMTMSSSLHGIIVSQAYEKKCMWFRMLPNKIGGENFKFWDYYLSVGLDTNMKPYILSKKEDVIQLENLISNYRNPVFPINTDHIMELCPF